MNTLMNLIYAVQIFWNLQRRRCSVLYFEAGRWGVPSITILVGRDREAWRISDLAIQYFGAEWVRRIDQP